MNTQLKKLCEEYKLSKKDIYELNQIFELLPLDKKQNILNNFKVLSFRLKQINKEIQLERRILVWEMRWDISNILDIIKQ